MISQSGARWIAEDRGLYDIPQDRGQDVSVAAYLPCLEAPRNTACPLYPLPLIARIDWPSLFRVFPQFHMEIH